MNRTLAAAALCAILAACSPGQIAATATSALLLPEVKSRITGLCRQGEPLVRLAAALPLGGIPAAGAAKEVAAFVAGYCDQMLAGAVPPTTDGNTESWLAQNIAGLRGILAQR